MIPKFFAVCWQHAEARKLKPCIEKTTGIEIVSSIVNSFVPKTVKKLISTEEAYSLLRTA